MSSYRLLVQSSMMVLALGIGGAAQAQTTVEPNPTAPQATAASPTLPAAETTDNTIIVTGSILRRRETATALPITSLSSQDLQSRGITTIADAVSSLSNNNAGNLPTSFSANGAFASGASGASLRGLTTSSTLVLFDGLRAAYYPLADDGTRNFVDLNTIPYAIVDRVETLKDGASATYGADAVAGVINVILKKEVKGFHGDVSAGVSARGDSGEKHASATYGIGDLHENGYNFYISGEYQRNDPLRNSDRGFPYNTADLSRWCAKSVADGARTCATNTIVNGVQFDGTLLAPSSTSGTIVPIVRPVDAQGNPLGAFQLLNPAAGCRGLTPVTLTPDQQATDPNTLYGAQQCQQDNIARYAIISPKQERLGGTAHFTARLGDKSEAYAAFTYYQSRVGYSSAPSNVLNYTPPGATGQIFDTRAGTDTPLTLPVYICARGTTVACTAANGQLNPNNPFAALGQGAQIRYQLADIPTYNMTLSRTFRGAAGMTANFSGFDFRAEATAMRTNLTATQTGQIFVQHLLDVIADGSYNFVDPSLNTQTTRDYLTPVSVTKSHSELYQAQASLQHNLFELPGGSALLAVGAAIRYEAINNPSANPDSNGSTQRYFNINAVGAIGHRTVYSAYFESDFPVLRSLDLNVSGRYDKYSSGQKNFSPKVSAKFSPARFLTVRGSYSRGFRIPSFSESNGLPTTGFITVNAPDAFNAAHGNNGYGQNYGLGLTNVGTPGLKPEKSRNITAGVVFQPARWLDLTVDYYNIRKTNVITGADYSVALNAYYAGQPIPAGFLVTPDAPDPQFPNLKPRVQFIRYGFINANRQQISGLDFGARLRHKFGGAQFTSSVDASYIIKYTQTFPGGSVQRYDGTLGPYVITSASGTPKWRGTWQNSLAIGRYTITGTANYTSGYQGVAEDVGGTRGDCFGSAAATGVPTTYRDGITPIRCRTKAFVDIDLTGEVRVSDRFSLYGNVINLFDVKPPLDPTTYGGYQYNPAWANAGIVGRYFRMGARFKL
jgi:iron complex outermembrane receptor protein